MDYSSSYWKSKKFGLRIMVAISAVVGLFVLMFFVSKSMIAHNTIHHLEEVMDEVTFDIEADATQLMSDLQQLGETVQKEKDLYMKSIEEVNGYLEGISVLSPLIDGGTVVDADGDVVGFYPSDIAPVKNLSDRTYVQEAIKSKSIYISNIVQTKTNRSVIVVAVPILKGNKVERVVNLSIRLGDNKLYDVLGRSIAAKGLPNTYIVDEQGSIIFDSEIDRLGKENQYPEVTEKALNKESGHMKVTLENERTMYAFYHYIPSMRWGIVSFVPTNPPSHIVRAYLPYGIMMLGGFTLLAMLVFLLVQSRTRKQLQTLSNAMEQVSAGDFTQKVTGIDSSSQVGVVASKFNDMMRDLEQAREDIKAQTLLREQQRRFLNRVVNNNPSPIYVMDWDGKYLLVNYEYASLFNQTPEEMIGKTEAEVNPNLKSAERTLEINREVMDTNTELRDEEYFFDYQGNMRWFQYGKVPIISLEEDRMHVLYVGTDITDLKRQEEQIRHLAFHDELTSLPNRKMFKKELEDLLVYMEEKTDYLSALLYFDLDRFKYVNDTFGHEAGDVILQDISYRIQQCVEAKGAIFRLGGDEFTVLLPHIKDRQEAAETSKQILTCLTEPYDYKGHRIIITASIGISLFAANHSSVDTIVKQADIAMYQSKLQGKNTFRFYSEEMETEVSTRLRLEVDLQQALKRDELSIHYQPIIDNQSGKMVGMEALLRWEHSKLGYISPGTFIPIAEEIGLIEQIGNWVLRNACYKAKYWQDQGYPPVKLSVNLSALQLKNNAIVQRVNNILEETKLEPKWLELEITESSVMENKDKVIQILKQLRQLGVSVAIDDFGIGYSSLNSLESLPIDTLKIDKTFVGKLEEKTSDVILSAILDLAEKLKLTVVAEGIETEEQHRYLKEKYCHKLQGFLFSQPLNEEWFGNFLERLK
ncbi:bifunctional diguanylate cyclase/phosphodiesterase [Radiobacillus deserti]|nr:EAL domain-containing protein [Radiobacillus deserti]